MRHALGRQVDVYNLRHGQADKRQKDALHRLCQPRVFHGRLADDGRRVNGVLAMRDRSQVEDRVLLRHGVEAGVIAERAFAAQLSELHIAFKDVLRICRHFERVGFALHQLHG